MNGQILFKDAETLAAFLKAFEGCAAVFTVEERTDGLWILKFTGGC